MANGCITLIGMPGAGKSSLGVVLAKKLAMDFVDSDLVIQKTCGATLQELIDSHGVPAFLELENSCLCALAPDNAVIATGGSAVYSAPAMEHLAQLGPVVYLRATLPEIEERLGSLAERGVVMRDGAGMPLSDIYAERVPLYEKYATITYDVNGMSIRETVEGLVKLL